MSRITTQQKWTLASLALNDAYTDFVLSRQAMQCSPATMQWYSFTAARFLDWLVTQSINQPDEIPARHVRAYLAELSARDISDKAVNAHGRAVRTLLRFWHSENYIPPPIKFEMPKIAVKRLPVLSADEVGAVLPACGSPRHKAIIMLPADTGLRRSEILALDWGDVDIMTGLARVRKGKGGKARSVVIGARCIIPLIMRRSSKLATVCASPAMGFKVFSGDWLRSLGFTFPLMRFAAHSPYCDSGPAWMYYTCKHYSVTPPSTWCNTTSKWLRMIYSKHTRPSRLLITFRS